MDQISTPWVTVHLAQLLSLCVVTEELHKGKNVTGQATPVVDEVDKVVEMKDSVCVGPFQTEILKGRVV